MMMSPPGADPVWTLFAAVAVVTGMLGWFSHFLAMWLSFKPVRFTGIGPFGWQGIIPKQAGGIASQLSKDLIQQVANVGQILEYLSPEKIVTQINSSLRPQLDTLVDQVMLQNHTVLWENLPITIKNRMYARMHRMLPRVIDDIIEDIGDQILWLVKIEPLVVAQFESHPEKLVKLFQDCHSNTFTRIAWFFALSCSLLSWAPLLLWFYLDIWWILPVGLSVLLAGASWIALRWLVSPSASQKQQMLETFINIVSDEILTSENIFDEVLNGAKSKHAQVLIKKHINKIVDTSVIRSFVQVTTGLEGFVDIKQTLCEHISKALVEPLHDQRFNRERADALKQLFKQNIELIDDDRFKALLWPTMQAEKWPLLVLSASGGLIAGLGLLQFFS